jgi:hypothetical protein
MNTNTKNPPARDRIVAATMLVAAGAIVAGALGAAAPANAADNYVAIAWSNGNGIGGAGVAPDAHTADIAAINDCVSKGGDHCGNYGDTLNGCIAVAVEGAQLFVTATGPTRGAAEQSALAQNAGSHIGASGCAVTYTRISPPPPTAPVRPVFPVG